ncbi:uncharacterized protein LOC106013905 [Aplysia californica]|uniref:Uncharacterized protein LOC106013905 n=1 Tax=Aplysia californica TaxID=6500 RepID=A0ABM1AEM2_APLCA|nr:uncharacterized protein LOC106013905 [Aplysia californica]
MQEGANPHVPVRSMTWLADHFGDRVISRKSEHIWAPHSPDLNPLDFFLWGYLKDRIFQNQFENIEIMKQAIRDEVRNIPRKLCLGVIEHFKRRVKRCLESKGGHVEH